MERINVCVIGEKDHGKSTLIGRLLFDSDNVTAERISEVQAMADEYKKRFEFAYFIDALSKEIEDEMTIGTSEVLFKSKKREYAVIDVPGHEELLKNMMSGASRADIAIIVISAVDGVVEQTIRHAYLVDMIGIRDVVFVINKMDEVDYSMATFTMRSVEIVKALDNFRFKEAISIPISAYRGDNLYKQSRRMPWYGGITVVQALDNVVFDKVKRPLRFSVQGIYKNVAVGRVESGILTTFDKLSFPLSGIEGQVRGIVGLDIEKVAIEGDCVGIKGKWDGLQRGDVGGLMKESPEAKKTLLVELYLLEGVLTVGDEYEFRCGTKIIKCKVLSFRGEAREVYSNESATVVLQVEPIVAERFEVIPSLGRFTLSKEGKNIGVGIILEVL